MLYSKLLVVVVMVTVLKPVLLRLQLVTMTMPW